MLKVLACYGGGTGDRRLPAKPWSAGEKERRVHSYILWAELKIGSSRVETVQRRR